MYKYMTIGKSRINKNDSVEGEPIEKAIQRLMNNGDTKFVGKDIIYTRPEEGVPYGTNIRDDKWDKALENTDKVTTAERNRKAKTWDERKAAKEEAKKKAMESKQETAKEPSVQANPKSTD